MQGYIPQMSKVERAFLAETIFKSKSYIAVQAVL